MENIEANVIISRATFLSNILFGGKVLGSFELAKGYTPGLVGLPQTDTSQELVRAHEEQSARRAIARIEKNRKPRTARPSDLKRGTEVYFFKKGPKFGA